MLPSVVPRLATDSAVRVFPVFGNFSFLDSFPGTELHPYLFCLSFYLLYFFLPPFEDNGCFSVCLMSSASIQKLLWNFLSVQMFF